MKNAGSTMFRICLLSCIITAIIVIYIAVNILFSALY